MDDGYCEILSAKKGQQKLKEIFFYLIAEYLLLRWNHIQIIRWVDVVYDGHKTWVMRKEIIEKYNSMHVFVYRCV